MRIAVIGCGNMGGRRLGILRTMGGHDLLAYDVHSGQLAYASGAFDVGLARQLPEVWDWRPDAVLICTPPDSHAELLREAHSHGVRAMFVEKPLSDKPIDVSPFADCVTMVGCNWRFHPAPIQVREWLQTGEVGRTLTARFRVGYPLEHHDSYVTRVGAVLDIGVHLVDLALDWFGLGTLSSAVLRDASMLGLPRIDGVGELLIDHNGGAVSSISVNLLQNSSSHRVEVIGCEGEMGYDIPARLIYSRPDGRHVRTLTWSNEGPDMFKSELTHFLSCMREGKPTCNPLDRAARTLDVLLEGRRQWQER